MRQNSSSVSRVLESIMESLSPWLPLASSQGPAFVWILPHFVNPFTNSQTLVNIMSQFCHELNWTFVCNVFVWLYVSIALWEIFKNAIGGLYGKCMLYFLKTLQSCFLKNLYHFTILKAVYESCSCSTSSSTFAVINLLNFILTVVFN